MLNETDKALDLRASSGLHTDLDDSDSGVRVEKFKIELIAEERVPHVTNQVQGDLRVSDQEWAKREGIISFAGYPLLVGDELLGVLSVFSKQELPAATIEAIGVAANFMALGIQKNVSEEAARIAEESTQRVLASSSDCINILDLDLRISYMNPSGMKVMEVDNFGTCENADWCSFWDEQDRPVVSKAVEEAKAGRTGNFHAFAKTFKGTPKWWDVVVSPIKDAEGTVVKILASSRDVTEQKLSNDADRKNAEKLAAMVEERTSHLQREATERKRVEADLRKLSSQLLTLRDEERRRIARDLHDSLGQILTAATMTVSLAQKEIANSNGNAERALANTSDLLQQAMKEVRVVSQLLHPPLLDEMGIGVALQIYTEGISARGDLQVELSVAADFERLPLEVETAIFRIVQECLTNVHRHSGSKTASVQVKRQGEEICVEIADRGKGMRIENDPGVGLRGMQERVAQLRGALEVKSSPEGTTVSVRLPFTEAAKRIETSAGEFRSENLRAS